MHPDDTRLIAQFLSGERDAAERVRLWIEQALRSYRLLAVGREDVVQEALLEVTALLRRGAFRGAARFRTFIWKVANNVCLNCLRAESRRRCCGLGDHERRLASPADALVDAVARTESISRLERVACRMPEECRQLWTLLLEGLSYEEMSLRLGQPEGTLRVRALRCRRKALALWDEAAAPQPGDEVAAPQGVLE
jgi:RNA polymerase sigma-70 factor, ECF subfamily